MAPPGSAIGAMRPGGSRVPASKSGLTKRLASSLLWHKANGIGFCVASKRLREGHAMPSGNLKCFFYAKAAIKQTTLPQHSRR